MANKVQTLNPKSYHKTQIWTLDQGRLTIETKEQAYKEQQKKHKDAMFDWMRDFAGKNGRLETMTLVNDARLTIANPKKDTKLVFELQNLTVHRGNRPVITDPLNFVLRAGDIAILEAPNGWGKSTLADAIMGIIPVKSGVVKMDGDIVNKRDTWDRVRSGLSLMRSSDTLFKGISVKENVRLNKLDVDIMKDKPERKAGSLSGGESRRLSFESVLYNKAARVVILDEPFQALDTKAESRMRGQIVDKTTTKTFLIIIPKVYE